MPDDEKNEKGEIKSTGKKNFFTSYQMELIAGILMIIGLITAFFHRQIGGALVGFSLGIYFFEEIISYFSNMKSYHETHGTFKTLMLIGGAIYFLLMIPAFLIACVVGFFLMYLMHRRKKQI